MCRSEHWPAYNGNVTDTCLHSSLLFWPLAKLLKKWECYLCVMVCACAYRNVWNSQCAPLLQPAVQHPALGSPAQEGHQRVGVNHGNGTKMIRGMELTSMRKGWESRRLFRLEKKQFWSDLLATFQYPRGVYKKEEEGLLIRVCSDKTRGNGIKQKKT